MEATIVDREQRITKLQDQIIELQKNMMMNQKSASSSSPPAPPPPRADDASTTSRLGSLFLADPDAAPSSVTLPSIFPEAPNSATSACSSSVSSSAGVRKPSKIPSANRRRSAESRSRCKSRVDRPLSSNAAQEKTVEEMKVEIQVGLCHSEK